MESKILFIWLFINLFYWNNNYIREATKTIQLLLTKVENMSSNGNYIFTLRNVLKFDIIITYKI